MATTEMSSRLIIKNLPSKISAERLKSICSKQGMVTDCQLKCAKNGKFRNFAFVGFQTVEEADNAKNFLNNTFIDSSKIQVEFCRRLNVAESEFNRKQVDDDAKTLNTKKDGSEFPGVLIENLPLNTKKKSLLHFFLPLKPLKVDFSNDDRSSVIVKLKKKSDAKILLKFNDRFYGGNKLKVVNFEGSSSTNIDFEMPREQKTFKQQTDIVLETGRLFVRNVPYICTLNDLEKTFESYGPIAEIKLPLDSNTKQHKGYAIVSFVMPEHALKAFSEMDGVVYHGRMLHIVPGEESKESQDKNKNAKETSSSTSSYKTKKAEQLKTAATSSYNWNTLFLSANTVADVLVGKLNVEKSELLNPTSKSSLGIRVALGETQIVRETREFLIKNGVCLDSFSAENRVKRSSSVIIVKNLPANTLAEEIRELFSKHGALGRVILPSSGVSALIEFLDEQNAKKAFKQLAYKRFKTTPLFLEWAPENVFVSGKTTADNTKPDLDNQSANDEEKKISEKSAEDIPAFDIDHSKNPVSTIFVKNLNFETNDEALKEHFSKMGPILNASVAKKKAFGRHLSKDTQFLSMGYGFVQYTRKEDAIRALKELQKQKLDGFALELKFSEHASTTDSQSESSKRRKNDKNDDKSETATKILVRNIPFQANRREIEEIFKTFGELRNVRLPQKAGNSKSHRGFGFVDFTNRSDAVKAFEALSHSTHLYGRRLVLSWAADEESLEDLREKIANFGGGGKSAKRQKLMLEDLDKTE